MSKAKDILEKLKDQVFMTEKGLVSFEPLIREAIAEIKAMETEIKKLSSKCSEIAYDFENAVNEIELLKQCVEEAIKRPMGVEPSIYSDYKMPKDNA